MRSPRICPAQMLPVGFFRPAHVLVRTPHFPLRLGLFRRGLAELLEILLDEGLVGQRHLVAVDLSSGVRMGRLS